MKNSIATAISPDTGTTLESIIKEVRLRKSQQLGEEDTHNIFFPDKDFEVYDVVYDGSFIVAGIVEKIAFAINTGFDISNEKLKKFLEKLEILVFSKNLSAYGNLFLEIVRNKKGEITEINPILTNTMSIIKGGGFIQRVGTDTAYFNAFTPYEQQKEQIEIRRKTGAKPNELRYDEKLNTVGFNPNLNECLLVKIPDIKQKKYGISLFDAVLPQILLLKYIDEYYNKYFDQGNIQQKVFYTEQKINTKDKSSFVSRLKEEAKGIKNAHKSFLLETKLNTINLTDELNTNAFLEYRRDLQKSIAMRLNIPYDLLDTTSSNRASSLTAIQAFNDYTVKPIQNLLLQAIKTVVSDDKRRDKKDIEELKFNSLNTKDWNIESSTVKNLYEQGMITLNEAREWMNFQPLPDGDKLKEQSKATFELGKDDIETISKMKDFIKQEFANESNNNH